jgi:putative heme-binding domain-containing protein
MSAEEYLVESIVSPAAFRQKGETAVMPANVGAGLKPQQILSIVGYLMTRGGEPAYQRLVALRKKANVKTVTEAREVDFAAVEAGKELYLGKAGCIKCHSLRDVPGVNLRSPNLLLAGRHDPAYLLESIREPSKSIASGYETWNVFLSSGKVCSGRLLRQGDESLDLLVEESGGLHVRTIAKSDIDSDEDGKLLMGRSAQSAMPDVRQILTPSEMELIVKFLATLR